MNKITIPTEIKTVRLILRRHKIEDAARMFKTVDKNRELFEEFLPWVRATKAQADTEDYIKSTLQNWEKSTGFDFSIILKDSGRYIGNVGLHTIALAHLRGEFGYWMDQGEQGKGYMTEAVEAFERVCFDVGLNRLEIRCAPSNLSSAGIPKKLGYKLEGTFRENFMVNGIAQDTVIFAKIKSDL